MSPNNAKSYYGLFRKPTVRETIQLPKGFRARHSHATNAARGVREITSPELVPSEAIKRVVRLAREAHGLNRCAVVVKEASKPACRMAQWEE